MTSPAFDPNAHKEALHQGLAANSLAIVESYVDKVLASDDPEVQRKAIDLIARVTGAEAVKKADPLAGLPMVNITFVNGGIQVSAQAPQALESVEEVLPEPELLENAPEPRLEPTAAMQAAISINADLAEPEPTETTLDDLLDMLP